MLLKSNYKNGIGLFGGTFDPVHIGHIRTATELKEKFNLREMRMILCARPPHRPPPMSDIQDRKKMLSLAINEEADQDLIIDLLECERDGPSFTLDTVLEIRNKIGAQISMCFCLGMDSFLNINAWNGWKDLLSMAHIVVTKRPGWDEPKIGELYEFIRIHQSSRIQDFHDAPFGKIFFTDMTPIDISSTAIRKAINEKNSVCKLLANNVTRYIKNNKLYR